MLNLQWKVLHENIIATSDALTPLGTRIFVVPKVLLTFICWYLNILGQLGQSHGCWCPGSCYHQAKQPWYRLYKLNCYFHLPSSSELNCDNFKEKRIHASCYFLFLFLNLKLFTCYTSYRVQSHSIYVNNRSKVLTYLSPCCCACCV